MEMSTRERILARKNALQEATTGNVDKLYLLLDKTKGIVDKAANALMDIADSLDDILVESSNIGGKIEEIVPSHIQVLISKITNMADVELGEISENGQSSLEGLKQLIGSIPYRDLKPETKEERVAKISGRPDVSTTPDLSNGPKSQAIQQPVHESIFRNPDKESLNRLDESLGSDYVVTPVDVAGIENGIKKLKEFSPAIDQSPIDTSAMISRDELIANDPSFEDDTEDDENGDPIGELNFSEINIPKGDSISFDACGNMDLSNLNESFENIVPKGLK